MSLLHRIILTLSLLLVIVSSDSRAIGMSLHDKLLSCNFNLFNSPPPVNSFELDGITTPVVNPAGMKGKVIILSFWKIDCSACTMEKPLLEKLVRKYSDRGLEVIAVNLFDRASDIMDYVKHSDFPFTYSFDAHQRYTVNQKRLPSGVPTTFVINSDSEAIYEIPGLPTTYVIDRNGRVVGYSVGLVNWDSDLLTAYLETLLGPPPTTLASASDASFSGHAGQGSSMTAGPTRSGPRRNNDTLPQVLTAPATAPIQSMPTLPGAAPLPPVQSTDQLKHEKSAIESGHEKTTSSPETQDYITVKTQKPPKEKSKPKSRQERAPASKSTSDYTKPKPFTASAPKESGSPEYPIYSTGKNAEAAAKDKALPPLPAAMPYSPPTRSTYSQPGHLKPDESGSLTTRVPGVSSPSTVGVSSNSLPAAHPIESKNTIGVSIMDSFRREGPPRALNPEDQPPQSELTPPATIIGQFSRDIQTLGAGIRDTFSSFLPRGN